MGFSVLKQTSGYYVDTGGYNLICNSFSKKKEIYFFEKKYIELKISGEIWLPGEIYNS